MHHQEDCATIWTESVLLPCFSLADGGWRVSAGSFDPCGWSGWEKNKASFTNINRSSLKTHVYVYIVFILLFLIWDQTLGIHVEPEDGLKCPLKGFKRSWSCSDVKTWHYPSWRLKKCSGKQAGPPTHWRRGGGGGRHCSRRWSSVIRLRCCQTPRCPGSSRDPPAPRPSGSERESRRWRLCRRRAEHVAPLSRARAGTRGEKRTRFSGRTMGESLEANPG